MVNLLLVSHSYQLAQGTAALVRQMAPSDGVAIRVAAGIGDDHSEIGTNALEILEALQELARSRSEVIVTEFVDRVESGKDENRPGFRELVKAVRNPKRGWESLLLYDTARLSRRRVISVIFEEVDCKLRNIMTNLYRNVSSAAAEYGVPGDFVTGANVAGFLKVADSMLAYGLV